ncbi:MAG: acetyl-CoA C-acyltransferase [Deltaproteobacteria bacterium]|nr:acetyl-CoA C-acyltransferase [Deltaproteobacteria bacterium]
MAEAKAKKSAPTKASVKKKRTSLKTLKVAKGRGAVLVEGVRTPFLRSNGAYRSQMAHDLGRFAMSGLMDKTALNPDLVDQVIFGTVVQDPRTSNLAREVALGAGIPQHVPSYTTTLACISANVAATSAVELIRSGQIDTAIVGGAESFSDPPIRLSKKLRQALVKMQKAKGPTDYLSIVKTLTPKDLAPDIPSAAEFSTGLTMGQGCERMAKRFDVTREEGDAFAVRSHQLAAKAWEEGHFDDEVLSLQLPPSFDAIDLDDGPRGDSTMESVAKLRPVFDKQFGTITAASSSFLTDGAAAVLLMSEDRADELGMEAKSIVRDYVYTAGDPLEELLLGPALAIPKLLERAGLSVDDIDVWEIHEAFAAQMVANLNCLKDDEFAKTRLGLSKAVGEIPDEKLNIWGGSLSLGHPFGATGGRLLTTASHRLQKFGQRYAVIAGCAAGGQGSAILLENPNF